MIIGTRASKLALIQAKIVASLLVEQGCEVGLKEISTRGDEIPDRSLVDLGGKGLFLKELEEELQAGRIDMAVHSMKDVPFALPERLVIGAVLKREDEGDAFLSCTGKKISELPEAAVIGTASLRRLVQVQKKFPQLVFKTLRGNVETRLAKMQRGEFDGIILAVAGLKRLGLAGQITERLDIISAVGQGAIAVECRGTDLSVRDLLTPLHDELTGRCVALEREFLKKVEGNCQTPIACHVTASPDDSKKFMMRYFLAKPDGSNFRVGELRGAWEEGESLVQNLSVG